MIVIRYTAVDGYSTKRRYKTLEGASDYARRMVGETPELGSTYAISGDGIGKITVVEGAKLADLFPKLAA